MIFIRGYILRANLQLWKIRYSWYGRNVTNFIKFVIVKCYCHEKIDKQNLVKEPQPDDLEFTPALSQNIVS